jgi:phosphoribosylanthranilate isomerase
MFEQGLIQIAGIHDQEESSLLEDLGVTWLGFPLVLDVHPEDCTLNEAKSIISGLKRGTNAVLITYETRPKNIIDLCCFLGIHVVQLHAPIHPEALKEIRHFAPKLHIIKSLIIRSDVEEVMQEAHLCIPYVDAFLTDTYDPESGASGATGKTHDWSISRALADNLPLPLILAGGLTFDNVFDSIQQVQPLGVDCHTGVEGPDGRKDPLLVKAFLENASRAYNLYS